MSRACRRRDRPRRARPGLEGGVVVRASRAIGTAAARRPQAEAAELRRIRRPAPGTQRGASTSSMRTSQRPPWARASSQLASAATSEPACSGPVGEGAKRPTQGSAGLTCRPGSVLSSAVRVVVGCQLREPPSSAWPGRGRRLRARRSAAARAPAAPLRFTTSRPAAMCGRAIGSGTSRSPCRAAGPPSLPRMGGTVSTSCPGSRLSVRRRHARAVSATATARWRRTSSASAGARRRCASGWCGATAKTNSSSPNGSMRIMLARLASIALARRSPYRPGPAPAPPRCRRARRVSAASAVGRMGTA